MLKKIEKLVILVLIVVVVVEVIVLVCYFMFLKDSEFAIWKI